MWRSGCALLISISTLVSCDVETPFGQRAPTAKIFGPNLAIKNTDIFFSAQVTSGVGIESLHWDILQGVPETGAFIVEQIGPLVRLQATGEGLVTLRLTVTDANGTAIALANIDLRDRVLGRTMNVAGNDANSRLGERVFAANDLDGDQHPDAIATAPNGRVGLRSAGFLDVFLGGDDGFEPTSSLHLFEPVPRNGSEFGAAVAVGDFNGDGLRDLIVGSPGYDTNIDDDIGRAYLYFGVEGGLFNSEAPLILEVPPTDFNAKLENDRFGASIAAGDFNLDGIDDFAISAPNRDRFELNFSEGGEIFVFLGNVEGLYPEAEMILTRNNIEVGFGAPEQIGALLVALPSFCGDPAPDLATSIPGFDLSAETPDVGAVQVYCSGGRAFQEEDGLFLGSLFLDRDAQTGDEFGASIVGMGDFDLDQRDELAIGAPGQEYTKITGPASALRFGESIASLDIDGNGNNDLVVALPEDGAGSLLVYPSSPLGVGAPFSIESPSTELEEFGRSLISVGDVDRDGLQDLAAGTPGTFRGGLRLVF
jgi:hypothetical protein